MFANMKIGTKLLGGFMMVAGIVLVLGILAVYNMLSIKTLALKLAQENVPEVGVANQVERWSLNTMLETRSYAFTEDKKFLDGAEKNLGEVKRYLGEAKAHADKYNLTALRDNAAKATAAAAVYERLMNETVVATDAMAKEKAASLVAADKYMDICNSFLASQMSSLDSEIGAAKSADQLKERLRKTILTNNVIDLGNTIRLGTWQSIATRDPKLFQDTEKKFEEVNQKLDELKSITRQEVNLKEIESCRAAGKEYLGCMERFLIQWFAREEIGKKRNEAADQVLQAAQDTSALGMKDTSEASGNAAGALGKASTILIFGVVIAMVLAIGLGIAISRAITGPVLAMMQGMKSIALGDLSARVVVSSGDEIGQLSASANQMAEALDAKAKLALLIGEGDLRQDVKLASDKDSLGLALKKMVENLREVVADVSSAAENVSSGSEEMSGTGREPQPGHLRAGGVGGGDLLVDGAVHRQHPAEHRERPAGPTGSPPRRRRDAQQAGESVAKDRPGDEGHRPEDLESSRRSPGRPTCWR